MAKAAATILAARFTQRKNFATGILPKESFRYKDEVTPQIDAEEAVRTVEGIIRDARKLEWIKKNFP